MAFTVSDFEDLERLLAEHPEWRARLRPLILGDEILQLPAQMRAVEARLDRIEAILERVAERQDAFDERLSRFEERMARFEERVAERQDAFDARMAQFDERMLRLEERMAQVSEQIAELTRITAEHGLRMDRAHGRMGNIEGQLLEARYHRHARDWFGRYLAGIEIVHVDDLDRVQSALDAGALSAAEVVRLRDVDLLVRGQGRDNGLQETIFAVEISQTVNLDGLERANEHALTLRRAGYNACAVAGGNRLGEGMDVRAGELGVLVDLHRAPA